MKITDGYLEVREGEFPGVTIRDGKAWGEAGGREWPVLAIYYSKEYGAVPILDIPMADEQPREAAL